MKLVIVINGRGGVGKDTLIEYASEMYQTMNVSIVTPLTKVARLIGWNGEKDDDSRSFLHELKTLSSQYNDYPMRYIKEQYKKFLKGPERIMFIHMREPADIERFKKEICPEAKTLLIKRPGIDRHYGNAADDGVEEYQYDYVYNNCLPLEGPRNAQRDFKAFIAFMVSDSIDFRWANE